MTKRLVSLFSGCGGMDLGFTGGFEVFSETINSALNQNWIADSTHNKLWG